MHFYLVKCSNIFFLTLVGNFLFLENLLILIHINKEELFIGAKQLWEHLDFFPTLGSAARAETQNGFLEICQGGEVM